MIKTAILTVSTTRTKENDESGKILKESLGDDFDLIGYDMVSDDEEAIITIADVAGLIVSIVFGVSGNS